MVEHSHELGGAVGTAWPAFTVVKGGTVIGTHHLMLIRGWRPEPGSAQQQRGSAGARPQ